MLVHSFPSHSPLAEPHVVRSSDGVALRPMSLEEAVKEAAFRDRDVFVFRDLRRDRRWCCIANVTERWN